MTTGAEQKTALRPGKGGGAVDITVAEYTPRLNAFLPLDLSDFEVKDNDLTEVQHLIFLRLVKQYWLTACPLPSADTRLARIARVSNTEWRRNREAVLAYFTQTPEGLEPDLYRDALKRAQDIAEKRREAGRKGGKISGARRQAFASKTPSNGQADTDTGTDTGRTTSISGVLGPGRDGDFGGLKAVSGGAA